LNRQASLAPASLLCLIESGKFLSLAPECCGAVLLQKPFYLDFAGPGAAIGSRFDRHCTAVYLIGTLKFSESITASERQLALQRRMAYAKQLEAIARMKAPFARARSIQHHLNQWLGIQEAKTIPDAWVAQLVGLQPETIAFARKHGQVDV
jgi:hypothetical protein